MMWNEFKPRLALIAVSMTMLLSGCLSEKGEEDNFSGEPTAPPTSGNTAPTISGNPPLAIKVGEAYSYIPEARDADGDSLTFSISSKPTWASFSTSNGKLSGTPTLADVGSHSNIKISVSDGNASASSSSFSIEVTQVATESATLSWQLPTQNEDGSALTDLTGFVIYFGRSSRNYSNSIRIDNPSISTYVVENLSPDKYYFAATSLNASGVESVYSNEATKTLN